MYNVYQNIILSFLKLSQTPLTIQAMQLNQVLRGKILWCPVETGGPSDIEDRRPPHPGTAQMDDRQMQLIKFFVNK